MPNNTHSDGSLQHLDGQTYSTLRIWKAQFRGYECHSPVSLVAGTVFNFFKKWRIQPGIVGHVSLELVKDGRQLEYISLYPNGWSSGYNREQQREEGEGDIGYRIAPDETIYLYSLDVDEMQQAFDSIRNNTRFNGLAIKFYDDSPLLAGDNCSSLVHNLLQIGGLGNLVQHHWIALYTPNNISAITKHAKTKELELYPETNGFQTEDEHINPLSSVENLFNNF